MLFRSVLEAVTAIGAVKRKALSSAIELNEIPFPQFPVAFITGGLPVPKHAAFVALRESG